MKTKKTECLQQYIPSVNSMREEREPTHIVLRAGLSNKIKSGSKVIHNQVVSEVMHGYTFYVSIVAIFCVSMSFNILLLRWSHVSFMGIHQLLSISFHVQL